MIDLLSKAFAEGDLGAVLLAIAVIVVVIVIALLRTFGGLLLSSVFDKKLGELKSEQQLQLETLKFEIAKLSARSNALTAREFEVIPDVWAKMLESYHYMRYFGHALQEHPDIKSMKEDQRLEFIENSILQKWQKRQVIESSDPNREYIQFKFWHEAQKAADLHREFHRFRLQNVIFLDDNMGNDFERLDDLISKAFNEARFNREYGEINRDDYSQLVGEGAEIVTFLGKKVRDHLSSLSLADG